jgi:hypothetical protein
VSLKYCHLYHIFPHVVMVALHLWHPFQWRLQCYDVNRQRCTAQQALLQHIYAPGRQLPRKALGPTWVRHRCSSALPYRTPFIIMAAPTHSSIPTVLYGGLETWSIVQHKPCICFFNVTLYPFLFSTTVHRVELLPDGPSSHTYICHSHQDQSQHGPI